MEQFLNELAENRLIFHENQYKQTLEGQHRQTLDRQLDDFLVSLLSRNDKEAVDEILAQKATLTAQDPTRFYRQGMTDTIALLKALQVIA